LVKRKPKEKDLLKGDKLRDLILLVHLNNKYGKGKNDISELKDNLGYSTGGIYSALDSSGYFERKTTGIYLTQKGEAYLQKYVLPQYDIFKIIGYTISFIGFILIFQWFEYTYFKVFLFFPWYSDIGFVVLGVLLSFFMLRLKYYVFKKKKKDISQ
jgi:hypothetical protein